jgi:hypothetical protein
VHPLVLGMALRSFRPRRETSRQIACWSIVPWATMLRSIVLRTNGSGQQSASGRPSGVAQPADRLKQPWWKIAVLTACSFGAIVADYDGGSDSAVLAADPLRLPMPSRTSASSPVSAPSRSPSATVAEDLVTPSVDEAKKPTINWVVSAEEWEQVIQRPLSVSLSEMELREMLARLMTTQEVGIALDRRIDPQQTFAAVFSEQPLRQVLEEIARTAGADVSWQHPVAFVGPSSTTRHSRTTLAHLEASVFGADSTVPAARQLQLSQTSPVSWNDLATPQEIITSLAERSSTQVRGLDLVPHDLWAGGDWPPVSVVQGFLLVLQQYDLGYDWQEQGQVIQIRPAVTPAPWTQSYPPSGLARQSEDQSLLAEHCPTAVVTWNQGRWTISGRWEDHEAAQQVLRPPTKAPAAAVADNPVPLSQRRFSIRLKNARLRTLIKEFETAQIRVVIDTKAFGEKPLDLDQTITVEVNQANAEEFFEALFAPLNVRAEIEGDMVRLLPAQPQR